MRIGIDISQLAYENTGVANYLSDLIRNLFILDTKNEYILFYSSLRRQSQISKFKSQISNLNVKIKSYPLPQTVLDFVWNKLHVFPIEWFIGNVDVFITSDWTEPPVSKAKKATILYDLIVYKYPQETHEKIVSTQKRKLKWVRQETDIIFCISEATKRDAREILKIEEKKLHVIYPGI
jgi:hypothetical protein